MKVRAVKSSAPKPKVVINKLPSQNLALYVFGEGSAGELGLGPDNASIDVRRPRFNHLLSPGDVGVVTFACGSRHTLAVTGEGNAMSWGSNENGRLGRNTQSDGGVKETEEERSDEDDDGSGLNPYESTPTVIDSIPTGTKIVKVAAGDSISLALTDDGQVYGWGCFRNQSGIMGFYQAPLANTRPPHIDGGFIFVQYTPRLYTELKKIKDIICGNNHAMALAYSGEVYIWGCGEQNQLGHHINERHDVEGKASLVPSLLRTGHRKYKKIYSGNDHAFAIDTNNRVWAWGLNTFGQTGIREGAGGNGASIFVPTIVESLTNELDPVTKLYGGQHHSLALTEQGRCLVFGRLDGMQLGLDTSKLPDDHLITDDHDPPRPRILIQPTAIPNVGKVAHAALGVNHSIAVNDQGEAYAWGVSNTNQTGLGTTEAVELPTRIQNTAVRDQRLMFVGCGGQFSILASLALVGEGEGGAKEENAHHAVMSGT